MKEEKDFKRIPLGAEKLITVARNEARKEKQDLKEAKESEQT